MATRSLRKVISSPSKIASALDWRKAGGSVLTVNIRKDRIGLVVSPHPSLLDEPEALESIKLGARCGKRISDHHQQQEYCKETLEKIVRDYHVCGVVVSFPLQHDTGRMGAACGRVLHVLDTCLLDTDLVTPKRPLCLWNNVNSIAESREDEWGRSTLFTQTSDKRFHSATIEQYNQCENIVAMDVWEDFCRAHWPDDLDSESRPPAARAENPTKSTHRLIATQLILSMETTTNESGAMTQEKMM